MDLQAAYRRIALTAAEARTATAALNLSIPQDAGASTLTLAATLAYHLAAAAREAEQLANVAPAQALPTLAGLQILLETITPEEVAEAMERASAAVLTEAI